MRRIIFSLTVVMFSVMLLSCGNSKSDKKDNFKVNITVTDASGDLTMVMQHRRNGEWVKDDSVVMKNGKASFSGHIDYPELYYFIIKEKQGYMPVWIDKGTIEVTTDLRHMRSPQVKGSKAQDTYMAYMDSIRNFSITEQSMGQDYSVARRNNDQKKMKEIEDAYNKLQDQKNNYMIGYALRHNKDVVSAYIISNNSYSLDLNQLDSVVSGFDSSITDSYYVKHLKERVATLKIVAIGQPFLDFTLNDPDGNPVSLSSVVEKNKYVLVDFWASWCMPCRAENPNVVKAYNKYHDKGFTVFGVSFDKDHDQWVEAIKKDGLVWTQVSDLKYWSSKAGKLYGIMSIPHNILIGPDGKIIADNLRGQALQDKLKELLGE